MLFLDKCTLLEFIYYLFIFAYYFIFITQFMIVLLSFSVRVFTSNSLYFIVVYFIHDLYSFVFDTMHC